MLVLVLKDDAAQQNGLERLEKAAQGHEEVAKWIRGNTGKQTLLVALDAFAEHIGKTRLVAGEQRISQTGRLWMRQVEQIKAHAKDMPLAAFHLNAVEAMIEYWRNRPVSAKTKKPMARESVRDVIKRIRMFIKWLHRNPAFEWRKPADLEFGAVRIPVTPQEKSAKVSATQVKTYSLEQLRTLFEYASPTERLYMLLALNCGFGVAEVSSLQQGEINLDEAFIKRLRHKTSVYGEWKLWDVTIKALRWYLAHRPTSKATEVILTKNGNALNAPTKGNNRPQHIQNAWNCLYKRICKDNPSFARLTFNKLRKTSGNLMRKAGGGEVAGMFLCHGQTVSDELLDLYTNRPFEQVFAALAVVRERLEPVFAAVAEPFPTDAKKSNPALSLGKIRRMKELKAEGHTVKKIAEMVGCSDDTVRKYLKKG